MSFSKKVKEELAGVYPRARHCELAELSALTKYDGKVMPGGGVPVLRYVTENRATAIKCFTLLRKTFKMIADVMVRTNSRHEGISYYLQIQGEPLLAVRHAQVQSACCKRAYIRGAFLASGSVSDPGKSYHFEIVCEDRQEAEFLQDTINSFDIDSKVVQRKKSYVVYLKEGAQIVDILNIMGAHVALMELENVRILKDMRNTVNRKVNCEAANINKTVSASVRQIDDINYIRDHLGFDKLPENLRDMALTRLSYPDASLKELGQLLAEPVGKSGVNHRLRKLSEIASKEREK